MDRKILHVDMNNFYASVELLTRPDLRTKPVAVGGDESKRHGIVLAKNEVAKSYGVKTAETLYQARQKCPDLVILPPHHKLYSAYSKKAQNIYLQYTEKMQSFGPDEAWLDLSDRSETGLELAQQIQKQVLDELGLTVSIGVSWNKIFAKMGSDYKKPFAITVINAENYQELLWPLPVEKFLFVGTKTARKLNNIGIYTIGDLAQADPNMIENYLGKNGLDLVLNARGQDTSPVLTRAEQGPSKSIGSMRTTAFNLVELKDIKKLLAHLALEVAQRMAKANMQAYTIRIYVRDADFKTFSRQITLQAPVTAAEEIYHVALNLFLTNFSASGPFRLLGITCDKLEPRAASRQLNLLDMLEQQSSQTLIAAEPDTGDSESKSTASCPAAEPAKHLSSPNPAADADADANSNTSTNTNASASKAGKIVDELQTHFGSNSIFLGSELKQKTETENLDAGSNDLKQNSE